MGGGESAGQQFRHGHGQGLAARGGHDHAHLGAREFAGPEVPVTMMTTDGLERTMTMDALLPGAFSPEHMSRT